MLRRSVVILQGPTSRLFGRKTVARLNVNGMKFRLLSTSAAGGENNIGTNNNTAALPTNEGAVADVEIPQADIAAASSSLPDSTLLDIAADLALNPAMTSWSPKFLVMQLIENTHLATDLPYWGSIVAITIGLRVLLLPVAIKTVVNGARMAAMRPEMQKLQDAFTNNPNQNDTRVRMQFQTEMKGLFVKYKVNPLRSFLMPLFQMPIFISFFMGLRLMGEYFPGFTTGGAFWFQDLSAADPYMIFPIVNALSFLAMIELGSDGFQTQNKGTFKWAMRGLAVVIAPLTMSMPQGLFVYWTANNVLSIGQSFVLKSPGLKKALDIPDPPKDAPDLKISNPIKKIAEALQKERAQAENAKAEIVDGSKPPPPPVGPPPKTFSAPPKKQKA